MADGKDMQAQAQARKKKMDGIERALAGAPEPEVVRISQVGAVKLQQAQADLQAAQARRSEILEILLGEHGVSGEIQGDIALRADSGGPYLEFFRARGLGGPRALRPDSGPDVPAPEDA